MDIIFAGLVITLIAGAGVALFGELCALLLALIAPRRSEETEQSQTNSVDATNAPHIPMLDSRPR